MHSPSRWQLAVCYVTLAPDIGISCYPTSGVYGVCSLQTMKAMPDFTQPTPPGWLCGEVPAYGSPVGVA